MRLTPKNRVRDLSAEAPSLRGGAGRSRAPLAVLFATASLSVALSTPTALATRVVPGVRVVDLRAVNFAIPEVALNNQGRVAFRIMQRGGRGGGYINPIAVFSEAGGNGLVRIAERGDPAPGIPQDTAFTPELAWNFDNLRITDSGQTFFGTSVCLADGCFQTVYRHVDGELQLVVREGGAAPGFPDGVVFDSLHAQSLSFDPAPFTVNDAGEVAFYASVRAIDDSGFQSNGVFAARRDGGLEAVAVKDDSLPLIGGGNALVQDPLPVAGIDPAGRVSFMAGTPDFLSVVFQEREGGYELVGPENPIFQTAGGEVEFNHLLSLFHFNKRGQIASLGFTNGGSGLAVFSNGAGGPLELLAAGGEPISGSDLILQSLVFGHVAISSTGETAFVGMVGQDGSDERQSALVLATSDGLTVTAASGDRVPGLEDGVVLDSIDSNSLTFNDRGEIAFSAGLSDGGFGLFAQDAAGVLRLAVRDGDLIDLASGPGVQDRRAVQSLQLGSTGVHNLYNRFNQAFNNRGELAFVAGFDGAKGVFVANVNAVPEPASAAFACLGCAVATSLVRRRHPEALPESRNDAEPQEACD